MLETQIWVLTGVVSVLATILTIVAKTSFKQLVDKLDDLIDKVGELTITTSVHKTEIDNQQSKNLEQDKRLNDHSKRLRDLEKVKK